VNVAAPEVPPHVTPLPGVHPLGAGVVTVTWTLPTVAISAAGTAAVIPVGPTNVVVSALVPQFTAEQGNKLFPMTERMKALPLAAAFAGMSELIDGTGSDEGAVMVKVRELEFVEALDTKTVAVPGEAVSAYVMAALSCVALTKVVGRGEPFQFTTSPFTKFVPFTSKVKPVGLQNGVEAICVVEAESEVMVGARIENEIGLDVPPPGVGVKTVTCAVPADKRSAAGINVLSCVVLR
jgi:hypothetical protein